MFFPTEKKVGQQVTNLHQKYTLLLVQWGYANVNIVNAMFGFAWAAAFIKISLPCRSSILSVSDQATKNIAGHLVVQISKHIWPSCLY